MALLVRREDVLDRPLAESKVPKQVKQGVPQDHVMMGGGSIVGLDAGQDVPLAMLGLAGIVGKSGYTDDEVRQRLKGPARV